MRVPLAVRQLIDDGVDPVVVAKTLLIGNRPGGVMYSISARAAGTASRRAPRRDAIGFAIRDTDGRTHRDDARLGRSLARDAVQRRPHAASRALVAALRRPKRPDRVGCGVVDLVDNEGIANRAWLLDAINNAQLPSFAPLEYKPT
jgi:hypothetical protein